VVHGVDFEVSKSTIRRKRRDDIFRTDRSETMHLETMKSTGLIVSIFFDMNGKTIASREEKMKHAILLHTIRAAFEILYKSRLEVLMKCKNPVRWFSSFCVVVNFQISHALSSFFPFLYNSPYRTKSYCSLMSFLLSWKLLIPLVRM
jgi:hypothetical protein